MTSKKLKNLVEHKKRLTHKERKPYVALCGKFWLKGDQQYLYGTRVSYAPDSYAKCAECFKDGNK